MSVIETTSNTCDDMITCLTCFSGRYNRFSGWFGWQGFGREEGNTRFGGS